MINALLGLLLPAFADAPVAFDAGVLSGMAVRNLGPSIMSGRVSALAGVNDASGRVTVYVGAASGGVWKSTDGGTTYRPVFDDQPVQSIGAITIDPRDPKVVWVGTGESWTRNSVSIGDGVYRSGDGGETWTHMGLEHAERISKILVDPRSSDAVWACVPGALWSDSKERGLYHSVDGGQTWTLALAGPNGSTGCGGVSMDVHNPDVIYASLWDFRRQGWTFRSGGDGPDAASGSALMRSADGGKTWTAITPAANAGFAVAPYGRIAVAVAPSDGNRVYAFVESPHSALYVSDDAGATWREADRSRFMVWRPFYFANLIVDPLDRDRVFKTDGPLILSEDGGRSFSVVGGWGRIHGDAHDVWIDPANTNHVLMGDDGGMWYSQDGGSRWWKGDNLPIAQFYHVSVDQADPYNVYGGLQDNSSWMGPSAAPGGVSNNLWVNLYGGDGFWTWADPADPDYAYAESQGGNIGRVNLRTHESRDIQPKPRDGEKLRWNWNTPIHVVDDAKGTVYIGAQFLFRSRDHGQSWDRISPDLTTNDPAKQQQERSGGVTVDNSSAEMHTTIYAISPSRVHKKTIWVGTDDGNVQLTRNGGKSWTNVVSNIPGLPASSWVSSIQAGQQDKDTAYASFDRHTFGELGPWAYRTRDGGRTWTALVTPDQPRGVRGYAHVIKEDPVNPHVLYLGTELGLWISVDDGERWAEVKGGHFPAVAVRDLAFQAREDALVIATHGRGIWIIDDLTPIRALTPELLQQDIAFLPTHTPQQRIESWGGWVRGSASFVADNPPGMPVITWYQRKRHLYGKLELEVVDEQGAIVAELPASTRRGVNQVTWDMHMAPPRVPPAAQLSDAGSSGPRLLPGTYTVRLKDGDQVYETPLVVQADARSPYSLADRRARLDAAKRVMALFGEESDLFERIAELREQVAARQAALAPDAPLRAELVSFDGQLDAVRKQIVATTEGGAITGEERLREHTDQLYGAILSSEAAPAEYQLDYLEVLERELEALERSLDTLCASALPALAPKLQAAGLEVLVLPDEPAQEAESGLGGAAGPGGDPDMPVELPNLEELRPYF